MGFFDKIKSFFGFKNNNADKVPSASPGIYSDSSGIVIDITPKGFTINGVQSEVPIHIDGLVKFFGKPRSNSHKPDKEEREFVRKTYNEEMTTRVNYTWDNLGFVAYTHNGAVVNTFSITVQDGGFPTPQKPKNIFKGTLTINGKPWFGELMKGKDCDGILRQLVVGEYTVTGEYADYEDDDCTLGEKGFHDIEITLKKEN